MFWIKRRTEVTVYREELRAPPVHQPYRYGQLYFNALWCMSPDLPLPFSHPAYPVKGAFLIALRSNPLPKHEKLSLLMAFEQSFVGSVREYIEHAAWNYQFVRDMCSDPHWSEVFRQTEIQTFRE